MEEERGERMEWTTEETWGPTRGVRVDIVMMAIDLDILAVVGGMYVCNLARRRYDFDFDQVNVKVELLGLEARVIISRR